MYIRKTTHKNSLTGKTYATYKLIRGYRNSEGKVRQETLLNLGADFKVPEQQWKLLTDRVEQLLGGTQQLFESRLTKTLEAKAQSIVKQITKIRKRLQIENVPKVENKNHDEIVEHDYQTVDINSSRDNDVRFIGTEYLGHHAAEQLELPKMLENLGFNKKQVNIALACIITRLVAPASELKTHRYLTELSAMDELLDTEFADLQLQQLYLASDRLLHHKEALENALYTKERELFQLNEVITLFDLTNTYFEGYPDHTGAHRGRSQEKRTDCQLISLGILLDGSGFPKKSKILPGNISEASTLKSMLSDMSKTATVIMDAGIATKDNIEYLKTNGYTYIVVRREANLVMPDDSSVIVKDNLHNTVSVSLIKQNDKEVDLYCHSTAKEEQTKAYTNQTMKRFEDELLKLNNGLKFCDLQTDLSYIKANCTAIILNNCDVYTNGAEKITMLIKPNVSHLNLQGFSKNDVLSNLLRNDNKIQELFSPWNGQVRSKPKLLNQLRNLFASSVEITKKNTTREYEKVLQKIGRLKEHYKSIAYMYEINIIPDQNKINAQAISYIKKEDKLKDKQSGIYCLTSNRTDLPAAMLWETYTMLTDLESAFRSLKTELGMRPIYHQLERRIDGHLFISILAYHLLHTIRYQLKQRGLHYSWDTIRSILSTQVRTTTTLDLKTGGVVKIRKTSLATPNQAEIYKALGVSTNPRKLEKRYFTSSGVII